MENSRLVAAERGMDLSQHAAQPTASGLLKKFSLILVMEERHKRRLIDLNPDLSERIYRLREMVDQDGDIHDPVGSDIPEYRAMADEVGSILNDGFERIAALSVNREEAT